LSFTFYYHILEHGSSLPKLGSVRILAKPTKIILRWKGLLVAETLRLKYNRINFNCKTFYSIGPDDTTLENVFSDS
jgi:hypothetical protein